MTHGGLVTIRVLHSMRPPGSETRYANHMAAVAGADIQVRFFNWRTAFGLGYDIFHLHWPEHFVGNRVGVRALAAEARTWALIIRLRALRTPVVRTLHNVVPHDASTSASRRYRRIAKAFDALTVADVLLVPEPNLDRRQERVRIPHGHYREAFAAHPKSNVSRGRIIYFGLIKQYKGLDTLLDAFGSIDDESLRLRIVGKPADDVSASDVMVASGRDDRVSLDLSFVPDAQLVAEITSSALVVLPYSEMHSSGAVLVALSLDRPVLVPDSLTGRALQAEVGGDWVFMFEPPLDATRLAEVYDLVKDRGPLPSPDMSERDWKVVRESHRLLYLRLVGAG